MRICGVDEAGKGPVLGPMVTAGVLVLDPSELETLGIKDSKKLTPKKRESLFEEIISSWQTYTVVRTPLEIDTRECTMNAFTAACHAEVVRALHPDRIFLDACDVNAKRFGDTVLQLSGISAEICSEHKADAKYSVVGAASIVAKVTRDRYITELTSEYGEIGSGYPSDRLTIEFLTEYIRTHGEPPTCARRSWQTVQNIIDRSRQTGLSDFF